MIIFPRAVQLNPSILKPKLSFSNPVPAKMRIFNIYTQLIVNLTPTNYISLEKECFRTAVRKNFKLLQYYTVKTQEGVHCLVTEHSMTSLSFQTAIQKNEAKLSSFVQFGNEMASYRAL